MSVAEQSSNNTEKDTEIDAKRVYWHSRRGMLELDLLLVPFVEQHYRQLIEPDKVAYKALLECEDADIYSWLMLRGEPQTAELQAIVQKIVQRIVQNAKHTGSET